ncbi:hypothetical protein [Actinokineospora globicatena]|uniref:hypothetical protein n=1 Tax=Actinokineospora globicatena TaxID=103729 RepID=UPI0020A416BC|nr:hypothetical protein [Actinokineospora globicatena]MCP2305043.1 hypothetical protein [Actinokineospora globicatena]GLW80508.1 hypothetical protein Aglo01_49890 [Actinokineospora globicatena]GLW87336.1 hypothetical protein Aglo02_49750 [Actinokineospora globicatena]
MTERLPTYSVVVSREDDLWVAVVERLPGGATDVERFGELPDAVRDLISTLVGVEPDAFWIEWRYQQGGADLTQVIETFRQWERLAAQVVRYRDSSRLAAVRGLRAAGLSYREIADVIVVSHQRIGQLLDKSGGADVAEKSPVSVDEAAGDGDRSGVATPFDMLVAALLDSARRLPAASRSGLLATAASLLREASVDLRPAG